MDGSRTHQTSVMRQRQKKKKRKSVPMQTVRVDHKTLIEVPLSKNPKKAVKEWLEKCESSKPSHRRMYI